MQSFYHEQPICELFHLYISCIHLKLIWFKILWAILEIFVFSPLKVTFCFDPCVQDCGALNRVGFTPQTLGFGVLYSRHQTLGFGMGSGFTHSHQGFYNLTPWHHIAVVYAFLYAESQRCLLVLLYMLYSTKANTMLIGQFKFFFGINQSASSIGK